MAAVALAADAHPGKLRVGLFAGARQQPRWVAEAFAKVARSECAQIVAVGIAGAQAGARPFLLRAYEGLDRWAFGAARADAVDLAAHVPHAELLGAPFADLLALDLDVAFAVGEFDDAALDGVARLGVWRLHVDGAGEVASGEPLSGSVLTARLAAGSAPRIAYQSWSRTYPLSMSRNRGALLEKTAEFPLRALREAHRFGREWLEQRPGMKTPGGGGDPTVLPVVGRILRRGVEKALAIEQWSLAFRFGGHDLDPDLAGFTRIVPPADRDWSEPFALEKNGRYHVFFKETVRGSPKAHIAMLELGANGRWSAPVRVLERDYHLSHPFVLEHDGQLYLVPESAQNRTVEAYRCVDFPLRWRLERVLLDGVRLVDATFHRGADHLWLFANGAAGESGVFNDELYLFHARGLLEGWQPQRRNPVRSDARCTRPAGALYWRNGALWRPAQICVPRHGAGIALNRVLRLTPDAYAERQVQRIVPPAGGPLVGLHTVNRAGGLTVADALARRRRI